MGKYCLSAIETSGEREREIIFEEILEACPFIVMFGPKTSKKTYPSSPAKFIDAPICSQTRVAGANEYSIRLSAFRLSSRAQHGSRMNEFRF